MSLLGRLICSIGLVLLAGSAAAEAPGAQRIHALFVGIDQYRYSNSNGSRAAFSDLQGAVGDARRFKAAIAELYGVAVDQPAPGDCEGHNDASTTLLNACATRSKILAALDAAIAARRPGDTLLFYFAGHGSRYRDDEQFDQDTGYNGTILPHDARDPGGSVADIFDTELKQRKDRATSAGIYFVTVFDSCNSATATRDGATGQSRSAPPYAGQAPAPVALPVLPRQDGGYWVHLAAAQDGEEAQETGSGAVGARAGVFTTALIDTLHMPGMRDASFGDIIREVQLRVGSRGHAAQTPSAEGSLTASFGMRSRSPVLFDVDRSGGQFRLSAGALSGVTPGSIFTLYANQADAVQQAGVRAAGTVLTVADGSAMLAVTAVDGATLPQRLVAEEQAHFFPPDLLTIGNDLPAGPAHDAVAAVLRGIGFASVGPGAAVHVTAAPAGAGAVLRADDGTLLADALGDPASPGFAARLRGELQKVARVRQLLSLRTTARGDGAASATGPIDVCVAGDGFRITACPALDAGSVRKIAATQRTTATVINRGNQPLFVYLLAIDPLNAVDLVLPKPGEFDQKQRVGPSFARARPSMSFTIPGVYRFLTIATDQPIRADAFVQSGNGQRGIDTCASPLARLLCAANDGARDPGVTAVGNWSAQVTTVIITGKAELP